MTPAPPSPSPPQPGGGPQLRQGAGGCQLAMGRQGRGGAPGALGALGAPGAPGALTALAALGALGALVGAGAGSGSGSGWGAAEGALSLTARVVDITHALGPATPVWEAGEPLGGGHRELTESIKDGGLANVSFLRFGAHTGTHVDAPCHFLQEFCDRSLGVESLDLGVLMGPALVVDHPSGNVTAASLEGLPIPPGTERLLLRTENTARGLMRQRAFEHGYAGVTGDGAEWLVRKGVRLVGVDYLSVAAMGHLVETHRTLLGAEVVILEGLDLDAPAAGLWDLAALPTKIQGSDGAPLRAVLRR